MAQQLIGGRSGVFFLNWRRRTIRYGTHKRQNAALCLVRLIAPDSYFSTPKTMCMHMLLGPRNHANLSKRTQDLKAWMPSL